MTPERWEKVAELHRRALERPAAERETFLARASAGDPALRDEVVSLLAQEDKSFLEKPALEVVAADLARQPADGVDPPLQPGDAVSHFRILEKLGAGGMGDVYKAEDTRLHRSVALKFLALPATGAAGANARSGALERFQREARLASALNHPNICTIYDVGECEGRPFIAMELVEGQTLTDLLEARKAKAEYRNSKSKASVQGEKRGAESSFDSLAVARQMAEALEYAHEHGIIHRDLKPSNIKITPEGKVKILDFGLAKALRPEDGTRDTSGSPTLSAAMTEGGMILGTAAYMAPEQAKARPVDRRADTWAFGCVLFEMLSGRKPFEGESTSDILAAVIMKDPDWTALPEGTPREIERLIRRCLVKDPRQRWRDMGDARITIEETMSGAGVPPVADHGPEARATGVGADGVRPASEPGAPLRRRWWPAAVGGVAALAIGLAVARLVVHRAPSPPHQQMTERRLTGNTSENPVNIGAISPDGRYLAYADHRGLHLELIATGEVRDIPQPEGPAPDVDNWWPNGWFPDSTRFIAAGIKPPYRVSGWVVSILGGPPRKLRDDADPWSVSPDGTLIAFGTGTALIRSREIWLMGPQGEEPRKFVSASADDGLFWATWSPDGRRVAYERYRRTADGRDASIESRSLKGGDATTIVPGRSELDYKFLWLPSGRLLYYLYDLPGFRNGNFWEVRADAKTGKPVSEPRRITNWLETEMTGLGATSDGKRLAVTKRIWQSHVDVGELQAGGRGLKNMRRLTQEESKDYPCQWMPNGKSVLFLSDRNGAWGIYKQELDQTAVQAIVTGSDYKECGVASPDGSWILYLSRAIAQAGPDTPVRIMRVAASGGPPESVLEARGVTKLSCARSPATLCVFSEETPDQKQVVFSAFDPAKGRGRELARLYLKPPGAGYGWDLSRDGSRLAFTQSDLEKSAVQILPLAGGPSREINVSGWQSLGNPFWAADGRGVFVSTLAGLGATNLYVDLKGRAEIVWRQRFPHVAMVPAVPSPDGRHLAVYSVSAESNVWLLENF